MNKVMFVACTVVSFAIFLMFLVALSQEFSILIRVCFGVGGLLLVGFSLGILQIIGDKNGKGKD